MKKSEKMQMLLKAVTEYFLDTGREANVVILAEKLGWPAVEIRTILNSGKMYGIKYSRQGRTQYGVDENRIYGPSRHHLRSLLLTALCPTCAGAGYCKKHGR